MLSEAKTEIGILKQENIELQQKLESTKETLTQRRLRYERQSKAEKKLIGYLECNLSPESLPKVLHSAVRKTFPRIRSKKLAGKAAEAIASPDFMEGRVVREVVKREEKKLNKAFV